MSDAARFWDSKFGTSEYVYGTAPNEFLVANAPLIPAGGAVLSLGEGEGRNAAFLLSRGHPVTAVDASAAGLRKAEALAARSNRHITTVVADLAAYTPPANEFAGVISIFCHLPPAVRTRVLRLALDSLKPGGVLLLEAYHPDQLLFKTGGPPDVSLLVTAAALREDLTGMEIVSLEEKRREIHEGVLHNGMSAVTQLLARKPAAS